MKKGIFPALVLALLLAATYAWAPEGDPVLIDSSGGISTPQSSTQAGYWRGYELSGNGSNFMGWLVPDSITDDLEFQFTDTNPAGSLMYFATPSGNKSLQTWKGLVTTVGDPGSDDNVPTEQAVREGLGAKQDTLINPVTSDGATTVENQIPQFTATNNQLKDSLGLVTTVGDPGADTNVPTEQAVREGLNTKQDTLINPVTGPASTTENYFPQWNSTTRQLKGGVASFNEDNMTDGSDLVRDGIEFVIDGGGSAVTTGEKGHLEIPYNCTIQRVTMMADQSGSIVVDLWVDTYANFPPTDADSITASAPPTISSAQKSQDTTLTGWTTSLTAGSIIAYNVDSCSTITRCTVSLVVEK
jgi:hypothetical protein